MSLHEEAKRIIELVSARLDPLFQANGFNMKTIESDTSIFNEILLYKKENIQFRVSACLHPHDYPNSFNISLDWETPGNSQNLQLPELFALVGHKRIFGHEDLVIDPEINLPHTLVNLYEFCELILREISHEKGK